MLDIKFVRENKKLVKENIKKRFQKDRLKCVDEVIKKEEDTVEESKKEDTAKHTPTPIKVTHPENVEVSSVRLFRDPPWTLRLTIEGDRSYTRVKIVRAAPLSHPRQYISLLDA